MHEPEDAARQEPKGQYLLALSLNAIGVVYGDIGTSPLYALRECFGEHSALPLTTPNILGVLSLVFWSLLTVISLKYLVFILRADNRGEGGILALTALVTPVRTTASGGRWLLVVMGLFGAALLYGDGMITPAISVLSAVEGLSIATPLFTPYIIPITIAILIGLFCFQRRGTSSIGAVFGPIILLWLTALALLGVVQIVQAPIVLGAVSPWHALDFFARNGGTGLLVLGSVFLVVTGGEALYADMGHFGARPIRLAWFTLVLPALLVNYFGQGALLLRDPASVINPFYLMAPAWALYPLVLLATLATIIASQAVISGAFSLTRQAMHLGYCPRLAIEHTSAREIGQIYLPAVNWGLMASCICLVLGFGSSGHLAAAYGVAVSTTMVITTLLFYFVVVHRWHWSMPFATLLCGSFLFFDLGFFGANLLKITHGGWFPLLVAAVVFTCLTTWKRGREILAQRLRLTSVPVADTLQLLSSSDLQRTSGTAIYLSGNPEGTPSSLLHNIKHNKVLHERIIILNVVTEEVPHQPAKDRVTLEEINTHMFRLLLHSGFMEDPDILNTLRKLSFGDWPFRLEETTFFLGQETLIPSKRPAMARWRVHLFFFLSRNARNATSFFGLPPNRVVEMGALIEV